MRKHLRKKKTNNFNLNNNKICVKKNGEKKTLQNFFLRSLQQEKLFSFL